MSKKLKQQLDRIESKVDLLLQHNNIDAKSLLNVGGTIPPDDDEDEGNGE